MIIFDLDGTLANCEHRRHFVQKAEKPDWKAFFEACDQDEVILPTTRLLFQLLINDGEEIEIWSGRCASVREKTQKWLKKNIFSHGIQMCPLKMRPEGDYTPDDVLKERWLDEALLQGKIINFVFDDRPKVVNMWRRRGLFVFDCNQSGKEF